MRNSIAIAALSAAFLFAVPRNAHAQTPTATPTVSPTPSPTPQSSAMISSQDNQTQGIVVYQIDAGQILIAGLLVIVLIFDGVQMSIALRRIL